jgi:hypothetical protein
MLDVQCPHCHAKGQIMVPPVGAVIIGPCPHCQELVVVFCGQTLALDKMLMEEGPIEERREHLLGVLNEFLRDRISNLLTEEMIIQKSEEQQVAPDFDNFDDFAANDDESMSLSEVTETIADATISQNEVDQFTDVDLKLLDNRAYFKSIFG